MIAKEPTSQRFLNEPEIVSLGCRVTQANEKCTWQTHDYDEVCFVGAGTTTIGHDGKRFPTKPNTAYLFRAGEEHGFWNNEDESPDLWIIHYRVPDSFYNRLPHLASATAAERIWQLGPTEVKAFKQMYIKLSAEHAFAGADSALAANSWLQLILAALHRWRTDNLACALGIDTEDPELLGLWSVITESVGRPISDLDNLPDLIKNYDSLRHRFRRAFGTSPRAMMVKLRMHHASSLLLDGDMTVKEVARAVGYLRQHEFARAFRRQFGASPSEWRNGRTGTK